MASPARTFSPANPADAQPAGGMQGTPSLPYFITALFFIWGGITSLNDVIIPKLKELFTLSYTEVMLVQFAFFIAYFVVSIPGAAIVRRLGYMRTAVAGLLTMMLGCILFVPASAMASFPAFLLALFVLAAGITVVQVVANPLMAMLGNPRTAHSRLTFAQAFNSLGTTIFPYFGSILILGSLAKVDPKTLQGAALDAYRASETHTVVLAYVALAVALFVVAAVVWVQRKNLVEPPAEEGNAFQALDLLKQPRVALGALSIFLYVGAEVAIGSVIVNYLMQADVLGLTAQEAGKHVPLYWGGAMVGRFIGAYLLRIISPGKVLAGAAAGCIALLAVSGLTHGASSGYALLAIGLCNSIMFPTIFSLALEGLGRRSADGSGLLCVAIVGGAIVPLIVGRAADSVGLQLALIVPALCYVFIVAFGIFARHPAHDLADAAVEITGPVP